MATLIQGFGTVFIGRRDFWPDGSYVTTEWFVVFLVPLIPLRSVRVRSEPLTTAARYPLFSAKRNYTVSDERAPHVKQVLCVYMFTACYIAWIVGMLLLIVDRFPRVFEGLWSTAMAMLTIAALAGIPWIIPLYLRERSKRWRPGFK